MDNYKRLIHLPSSYKVSGDLTFMLDLIKTLKEYKHTVIFDSAPGFTATEVVWILQSTGVDVLYAKSNLELTSKIRTCPGTIIVYGSGGWDTLGKERAVIHYISNYTDLRRVNANSYIVPSASLVKHIPIASNIEVIPPGINTRVLRDYIKTNELFTVGIISTYDKYPSKLIEYMLKNISKDIAICATAPSGISSKDVIDKLKKQEKSDLIYRVPIRYTASINYLSKCDILIHAVEGKEEWYSRTVLEAMALGRPVIIKTPNHFADLIEDKYIVKCNTYEAILTAINMLKTDKVKYNELVDNSKIWASWQDITLHIDKIREVIDNAR